MTSEIEEAVARVEAELALAGPHAMFGVHPIDDLRTLLSALTASQSEVKRLTRDVNQFVTCMCGQPMSADHYTLGHAPVSVAEHYYNEQYARAQAAEARATRAEGLLEEAGEVLGLMRAAFCAPLPRRAMGGHDPRQQEATLAARAFLDKLKPADAPSGVTGRNT